MEFGDALWRKSSYSTDQTSCVEIAYSLWRKSSYSSGTETCVEVAYSIATPTVGIRDSKNPGGGHLALPTAALRELVSYC
jgi:Domain of unknown function (DUF397)